MLRRLALGKQRRQLTAKVLENQDFREYVTNSFAQPEEHELDYNPIQLNKYLEMRRKRLDMSLQRNSCWKRRDREMQLYEPLTTGTMLDTKPDAFAQSCGAIGALGMRRRYGSRTHWDTLRTLE
ncbi:hypothetical protein D915_003488 [Fasciola hepatica]|uniref:Uncharacterized protein n=1 Tax=Fasciola hepatica TaxID=6192 RepID=A0A4E0S274_FASHE|nr:hypothetical protein D915_003488 [Fasciola hepatica]